jgi:surface-anchored protein
MNHLLSKYKAILFLAAVFCMGFNNLSGREVLVPYGHYDLGLNFTLENGWHTYVRDFDNADATLEASRVVIVAGPETRMTIPDSPNLSFLGNPGAPIWILPEIYQENAPYLGIGAPLLERNLFTGGLSNRGQVTMRLVSLEGSGPDQGGHLHLWQSGFPPQVFFSSADGIGPEDALDRITANFHAHYNFGFTAPGLYRVTFELTAELLPLHGGGRVSGLATFSFLAGESPDRTPLRFAWPIDSAWEWSSWLGYFYRAESSWVNTSQFGWLFIPESDPRNFWMWAPSKGWVWSSQDYFPWVWSPAEGWKLLSETQTR